MELSCLLEGVTNRGLGKETDRLSGLIFARISQFNV